MNRCCSVKGLVGASPKPQPSPHQHRPGVSDGNKVKLALITESLTKKAIYALLHSMESTAFICLGSNIGDRELNLLRAVAEIGKLPGARITALSGFYDTEPVGSVPQDNFLNAVLRLATSLTPHRLLAELNRIETDVFHRKRNIPQGPRVMDLDILLFDDIVLQSEDLIIPHPRLHERRFVLVPLAELASGYRHPVLGKSIAELLRELPERERVTRI